MQDVEQQKKALLALMRDADALYKLHTRAKSPNIFDILKISKVEIRHSNMLAWLLNPNENHGIGDAFLQRFLFQIKGMSDSLLLKILSADLYSFQLFREFRCEAYPIDILLVSPQHKILIAIENKISSKEHTAGKSNESQLKKYKENLKKKYPGYDGLFVFLTPEGSIPTDDDWIRLEYVDVLQAIESVWAIKKDQLADNVSILIRNYCEIIKNEVVMDQELIEMCQKIYKKHKVALDLIYENRDDLIKQVSEECKKTLDNKYRKVIELEPANKKSYIKFWTKDLKDYFSGIESWNIDNYYYQIQIRSIEEGVRLTLELVVHKNKEDKLDENLKSLLRKLLEKKQKGDGAQINKIENDNWQWMRIWADHKNIKDQNSIFEGNKIDGWLSDKLDKLPM